MSSKGLGKASGTLRPMLIVLFAVAGAMALAWAGGIFRGDLGQREPGPREHPSIVISSHRLDFGVISLNKSVVRQLVLHNESAHPVRARLSVEDSSYSLSPDHLTLQAGASARVSVAAKPSKPGVFRHELRIVLDTDDAEPLMVALQGRVEEGLPDEQSAQASKRPDLPSGQIALQVPASGSGRDIPEGLDRGVILSSEGRDATPEPTAIAMVVSDPGVVFTGDPVLLSAPDDAAGEAELAGEKALDTDTRATAGGGEVPRDGRLRPGSLAVNFIPIDPAPGAPIGDFDEPSAAIPTEISDEEAAAAERLPSQIPEDEDPDALPEDLEHEEDPWDSEPTVSPTLSISNLSSLMLLGSGSRFSTQQVSVQGTNQGGPISLQGFMEFPLVLLAFGESMLFSQSAMAAGSFESVTGEVNLQLPVVAIDSDGNAAPMVISLTTGTTIARNSTGAVVSLTGNPRIAGSGLLKMVGIGKIPTGFRNGAEDHIVFIEIIGTLNFGASISQISAAQ